MEYQFKVKIVSRVSFSRFEVLTCWSSYCYCVPIFPTVCKFFRLRFLITFSNGRTTNQWEASFALNWPIRINNLNLFLLFVFLKIKLFCVRTIGCKSNGNPLLCFTVIKLPIYKCKKENSPWKKNFYGGWIYFFQYHCQKNGWDIHAINFSKNLILSPTFCSRVIYFTFTAAVKIRRFAWGHDTHWRQDMPS